ncbi:MAG: hypothetical protein GWO20_06340 [Candidatus Korarchaeota archaeon]|nr:hypothetical protein [Candidatus Korarchaeota archaeon]NIU85271.1 hypothetical protein [Candidatus Thorarchaeota archaeon]NIW15366.1 hypothetical protein [Candidatus Thorarchaeota archaeon]NIW53315.1 hypothetical protein [Candidatus Korarchaeota archaeon]
MSNLSSSQAADLIEESMGIRGVAVALYRVMSSEDPILVVKNEDWAKWLKILISGITEGVQARFLAPDAKKEDDIQVISKKEYESKWQEYGGREICLVEEEKTVKNPGVELMEEILKDAQTTSNKFIDTINRAIGRMVGAAEQIKVGMELEEELPEGKRLLEKFQVEKMLVHILKKENEQELVKHILILWGKKASEEEKKESLPFRDLCSILGKKKLVKIVRGLFADKNVVLGGHNRTLILKMAYYIYSIWPQRLYVTSESVSDSPQSDKQGILVVGTEKLHELEKKAENSIFIELTKPLKDKLDDDLLLKKIDEILELESEKSKRDVLKDTILSFLSILEDTKEILGRSEKKITAKGLEEDLIKNRSPQEVKYLLRVLKEEGSSLMDHIAFVDSIFDLLKYRE